MTNPAVLSRKEVDRWCRELAHENKELKKEGMELKTLTVRFAVLASKWVDREHHDWAEIKKLMKKNMG